MRRTIITNRARALRKAMTEPEVMLWSRLRGRSGERPTFRRQHPFGSMVLDFYCPSLRLAIEVDGATHWDEDARRRDEARDHWLNQQGVSVMRIPAGWIYRDLSGAMDAILLKIEALQRGGVGLAPSTPRSSAGQAPASAGGPPPAAFAGEVEALADESDGDAAAWIGNSAAGEAAATRAQEHSMKDPDSSDPQAPADAYSRRRFTTMTAAAAVAAGVAAAGCSEAAPAKPAAPTISADVVVKTADGDCEAVLVHPAGAGPWPGAVIWPDALGLRPVFREIAARLAGEGYAVLVVNSFYRSAKTPVFTERPDPSAMGDPNSLFRKRLEELRAPLTAEAVMRDADAFVSFLDRQAVVGKTARIGASGYCMGGPMTLQTAAARSDRIGAAASFHGGGLVTDKPDSPHLLIPKIKAECLVAIAQNDDGKEPQAKTVLKEAFAAAKLKAKVEVYDGAMHGWCVPGSPVYNQAAAEKAWAELLSLYKRALA